MPQEQLVVGARAIAELIGLPRRTVYDLVDANVLPTFRLGQRIVAAPSALHAWKQRRLDEAERKAAA